MRALRLATATLLVLLAAAPGAGAAQSVKKGIWGPVRIDGVSQFPTYKELGAGVYHTSFSWADVARTRPANPRDPADPAYQWKASIDDAVQEAARYGIRVAVMVKGTPGWANGGRTDNWAPTRLRDYADFMTAAARRYPSVRYWVVWGEPTRRPNFRPLAASTKPAAPLARAQKRGPHLYARLLDMAYGAIKRASPRALVVGGNSFTTGDIGPRNWIRNLKLPSGRPPRMDLYGHNPFGVRAARLRLGPLLPGTADICDLDDVVRWVDRNLGRSPSGRRIDLWLGEYAFPTAPSEFGYFGSEETQAKFLAAALRLARRWKRIETLNWLNLRDIPAPSPDALPIAYGLQKVDGRPKMAFGTYKDG